MSDTAARLAFEMDVRIDKLERALARAEARTKAAANRIAGQFSAANRKADEGLARSASGLASLSGGARFALQNTANQIGDTVVQIGSGTSAMRALSLQLPQMLGGFAAIGGTFGTLAPLLGTVAALGLPLAAAFLVMGDGADAAAQRAEALDKQMTAVGKSVDLAIDAIDKSRAPVAALRDEYGVLAEEVQRALFVQRELRVSQAQASLGGAIAAIAPAASGLGSGPDEVGAKLQSYLNARRRIAEIDAEIASPQLSVDVLGGQEFENRLNALNAERAEYENILRSLSDWESALARVSQQMGVTAEQAGRIAVAVAAVNDARGLEAQVQAAARLSDEMLAVYGSVQAADAASAGAVSALQAWIEKSAALNATLHEGTTAAGQLGVTLQAAGEAMGGVVGAAMAGTGVIAGLAGEAAGLAANLQAAASAWGKALMAKAEAQAVQRGVAAPGAALRTLDDERGSQRQTVIGSTNHFYVPPAKSGGGGGGGARNLDKQELADLARARTLYEQTRTAAERFGAELAELNRLKETGRIDAETYGRAVADLRQKMGRAEPSAFRDLLLDLSTGALSAADAFDRLRDAIIRAAAEYALFGTGPFAGATTGGGGLGGLLGGLLSGLPSFAGGGDTGVGARSGGLDGRGGFAALLHPNETVIDRRSGGSGGGTTVINVAVDGATGNSEVMRMVQSGVSAGIAENNRRIAKQRGR